MSPCLILCVEVERSMLASDRCNSCNDFYKNTISSRDEHLCSHSLCQTGQIIPSVASGQGGFRALVGVVVTFQCVTICIWLGFFDC